MLPAHGVLCRGKEHPLSVTGCLWLLSWGQGCSFSSDELRRGNSRAHEVKWHWKSPVTSLVALGLTPASATGISQPLSRRDRVPSLNGPRLQQRGDALWAFCCPPESLWSCPSRLLGPWRAEQGWCTGCVWPSLCSGHTGEIQVGISALQEKCLCTNPLAVLLQRA